MDPPGSGVKKRKASDASAQQGFAHPLGGSSQFGFTSNPTTSATTPLQPPKQKAVKKRKTKDASEAPPLPKERSTRDFTPTDDELGEDEGEDDEMGNGRGSVTGHKLSEAYRRLQSRRDDSKEPSEAEGSQSGNKKNKRNRVHFSCVEVSRIETRGAGFMTRSNPLTGAATSFHSATGEYLLIATLF